jgi:DNA-binding MarR family transcriptional regulator
MDRSSDSEAGDFDLSSFLPYRLNVVAARTSRDFAALYSEFGLGIPEWRVLAHLHREDGVSVREITARVEMDKSRVSRAADRMAAAGYIAKSSARDDRRLVVLRLTKAGHALLAQILPLAIAYQAQLTERLGRGADGFNDGLDRLLADDDGMTDI